MNIKEIIEKNKINTHAHLIDLNQIRNNLKNINDMRNKTGIKIFFALKGFSNDIILKKFINKLDGLSSSGLFEAKLGKELESKVSTFTPAYTAENIKEICKNSEYIVFNTVYQYKKYLEDAKKEKCSIGIRINPEYSELPEDFGSNTCKKDSHLGIRKINMPSKDEFCEGKIEGIHLHTMCEQFADTLERTIDYLINNYDEYLKRIKWINLGGGQLIGSQNYNLKKAIDSINKLKNKYNIQVILEPCEGIMLNSGYYITKVIDLLNNNINLALVDGSAVCHMSDSVYKGWTRDIIDGIEGNSLKKYTYKIVGSSCYAGDTFGTYILNRELKIGDYFIFTDASSYTMVKNNMFNGITFPNLYILDNNKIELIKEYNYECFKNII